MTWKWWLLGGALVLCPVLGVGVHIARAPTATARVHEIAPQASNHPRVEVVHPAKNIMEVTTSQPGSVHAYESVQLFAGVSGYLRAQTVDIGDRIKRGQVLATVNVPELDKQVQRRQSALELTRAQVLQMKARVINARAELDAARASVPQAEAIANSKAAELRFREKQLQRMKHLLALKSIDEGLVDEKTEQRDAAREAEIGAREGVTSARAKVAAMAAKIQQADADVVAAEAEVKVAQAELEGAQELVKFATIVAPFDGVVVQRGCFPGDYIRAAGGGAQIPLLTVQRTDRMRVIVHIPDRHVPYANPGDAAVVEIDALPDQRFPAKISRVANAEDPATRLMHVEIDLLNPNGRLHNGMYGKVSILLERTEVLTVPADCLIGKAQDGKGNVMVVRDGRVVLKSIFVGANDGSQVGILSGLKPDDQVVVHPAVDLTDDTPVIAVPSESIAAAEH